MKKIAFLLATISLISVFNVIAMADMKPPFSSPVVPTPITSETGK